MDEMRRYVFAYLGRAIDLDTFLDWFSDVVSPEGGRDLRHQFGALVGELDLRVAELTGGHITEDRFREVLSEIVLPDTNLVVQLGSSVSFRTAVSRKPVVQVGRRVVYA